jgi:acetylornithine deacetylase/succinyl-diaminopimelate desuccinylase-like protein
VFDKPKLLLDNHRVASVRMIFTMPSRLEEAKSLLREAMGIETYTPEGCREFVRWGLDTLRRECIGDVREVLYPRTAALGDEPVPYSNIVVDIGPKQASDRLLVQGHFDIVSPNAGYEDIAALRNPTELYVDPAHPHLWYGLGGYDMKAGLVATMMAAKYAKLPPHRALRLLWVSREEWHSEGIHAAKQSGLLNNLTAAVTTEIPVGGTLEDAPTLLHGRPGRIELEVQVRGPSKHRGQARKEESHLYAYDRLYRAKKAAWDIPVPEDPAYGRIWKGKAVVGNGKYGSMEGAMSIADIGLGRIDVYSLDPNLNVDAVVEAARAHIASVLGDDEFMVQRDQDRKTPPTPGWYHDPNSSFVRTMHALASAGIGRQGDYPAKLDLALGGATADEALIGVPTVTIPPIGCDEHKAGEVVDGRSITGIQVPAMIAIAEYDGDLSKLAL